MDINITDADRMEMHRLGKEAMAQEGHIGGKPVGTAADLMLLANYAEKKELRAEFMVGLTLGDYYTEDRAMKTLILLDSRVNRLSSAA